LLCPFFDAQDSLYSRAVQVKQAMAAGRTVVLLNHDNMCVEKDTIAHLELLDPVCCCPPLWAGRICHTKTHSNSYESLYDVLNQRYVTRRDPQTGIVRRMLRLGQCGSA
jgi:hypothetical protein